MEQSEAALLKKIEELERKLELASKNEDASASIRQSARELQELVKQAPVSIVLLEGEDLIIRVANQAALSIMGKTEEEVLNKPNAVVFPEVPERIKIQQEVFRTGIPYDAREVQITFNKFGKPYTGYYDLHYSVWYNSEGEKKGIMAVGIEVTEKAIAAIQQSFLVEISNELTVLKSRPETIDFLAKKIGRYFNVKWCMFSEVTKEQTAIVSLGWNETDVPSLKGTYTIREFLSEEQTQKNNSGQVTVVNNVATDPNVNAGSYTALDIHSFIIVPLLQGNQWKFMLSIIDNKPRLWRNDEVELMKEVTNRIWTRLEKATADEALHNLNNRLERQILERTTELAVTRQLQQISAQLLTERNAPFFQQQILDSAMQIMDADFSSLQMFISETKYFDLLASRNFHPAAEKFWKHISMDSIAGGSMVTKELKRKIINDIYEDEEIRQSPDLPYYKLSGIRSMQSTPLIARDGRFIGVLSTHWKKVHLPKEKDLQLFDILARQAVDLIELKEDISLMQRSIQARTDELKSISQDLKTSKEHFALLFNVSPVPKSLSRIADGQVIDVNPAWENMFEVKKEDVVGKNAAELKFTSPIKRNELIEKIESNNGNLFGVEVNYTIGKDKIVNAYISVVKLTLNGVECLLTAYFDITKRKQAEELIVKNAAELREKNLELESINEELESFNYIASHDLQEPLRKIQTFLPLMEKNLHDEERRKNYFDKTMLAAKRMGELIQSVLNYSRIDKIQQTDFSKTDLNRVLETVKVDLELKIQDKQAIIKSNNLPVISAIKSQVEQLFANIINNALKFSKEKPVINIISKTITGKDLVAEGIATKTNRKSKYSKPFNENAVFVELKFIDNGIGFEPQYSEKIFDLFQRLHGKSEYEGTGIGLSVVKKIVNNHNGFIMAESELDTGTTFTIWLPLEN